MQDARFERNNKGINGELRGDYNAESKNVWQFCYNRNEDTYVFPNLQDNVQELAYMTAWVGPKGDFDGKTGNYLIQKITGLKPGLYRVNCQGFYFNPGNQNDKNNTSFVFASQKYEDISNQTTLKTIESADWELMRNMTFNGSEKQRMALMVLRILLPSIVSMPVKYSQRAILMKTRMWTVVSTTTVWQSS